MNFLVAPRAKISEETLIKAWMICYTSKKIKLEELS